MKPRIGILTTFKRSDEAYSLVGVVKTQLQMLLRAGYDPVLFVAPSFEGEGIWSERVVEVRHTVMPEAKAGEILEVLKPLVQDIDVMFCHDIIFLGQHKEWAKAVRTLASVRTPTEKEIMWIHWQHSRGDHAPIASIKNSWYCYPNKGDLEHVARINSATKDRVKYVPHALDFDYTGWPELAVEIAEKFDFPFADVSMIYPSRLDAQKQVERSVRIFAGLKRAGKSVCLLVADAYATGQRFLDYKDRLRKIAGDEGLTDKEFVFLSEHYEECHFSTPRQVVKALMEMSNLFIQSSNAETSSLVVLEAALAGNLIILNADFSPIHHLYKKALTLPFGGVVENSNPKYFRHIDTADEGTKKIEDPQLFWDEEAKNTIVPTLNGQLSIAVKRQQLKERWPSRVFSEFIEPLIREISPCLAEKPTEVAIENVRNPDITAIITTLDNLPMLKRQIPILLEECKDIIVVNNGSVDGTEEWLNNLRHSRVMGIHRDNLGAGPGRNAGLDHWNNSTLYTLMIDGGILPPTKGVSVLRDYLDRYPDVSVVSPEVATAYTDNESEITRIFPEISADWTFPQTMLSGTAYALCRAKVWDGIRFSEEGPFGQPGWGCDDNDMMYRWNKAGLFHHDIGKQPGIKLYRRGSGSFKRLYEETGVWPSQYGSVYEQRNVKLAQDWRDYYDPMFGAYSNIEVSVILDSLPYPEFAHVVKKIHDDMKRVSHEIIGTGDRSPEIEDWLSIRSLRWHHGDTVIDHKGNIIKRNSDNEDIWSGDVIVDGEARGNKVIRIGVDELQQIFA